MNKIPPKLAKITRQMLNLNALEPEFKLLEIEYNNLHEEYRKWLNTIACEKD